MFRRKARGQEGGPCRGGETTAHTGRHRLLSLQRQGACPRPEGSQTLGQPSCGGSSLGEGFPSQGVGDTGQALTFLSSSFQGEGQQHSYQGREPDSHHGVSGSGLPDEKLNVTRARNTERRGAKIQAYPSSLGPRSTGPRLLLSGVQKA